MRNVVCLEPSLVKITAEQIQSGRTLKQVLDVAEGYENVNSECGLFEH